MGYLLGFEEIGDVASRRLPHEILGRVYLLKATLSHDGDAVRQRDSVSQIMRNVDGRETILLVKFHDFTPHLEAIRRIDVAQGFVHEQDPRRSGHGPAQSNPLLLATGKFRRAPLKKTFFNAQLLRQGPQKFADLFAGTIYVSLVARSGWCNVVRRRLSCAAKGHSSEISSELPACPREHR